LFVQDFETFSLAGRDSTALDWGSRELPECRTSFSFSATTIFIQKTSSYHETPYCRTLNNVDAKRLHSCPQPEGMLTNGRHEKL
jgi:hypothetical protein